jgi:hypothetical protein
MAGGEQGEVGEQHPPARPESLQQSGPVACHTLNDGTIAHSFSTLMADLATIGR